MIKTWTGRVLLVFAIFTLGYGLGRESGRHAAFAAVGDDAGAQPSGESKVLVYYLHTTFRCVDCNSIERMAQQVVATRFAAEVESGAVEYRSANFQERLDLASQYKVAASVVVVAKIEDGRETDYQRLDQVWTLIGQPEPLMDMIAAAVEIYLEDM